MYLACIPSKLECATESGTWRPALWWNTTLHALSSRLHQRLLASACGAATGQENEIKGLLVCRVASISYVDPIFTWSIRAEGLLATEKLGHEESACLFVMSWLRRRHLCQSEMKGLFQSPGRLSEDCPFMWGVAEWEDLLDVHSAWNRPSLLTSLIALVDTYLPSPEGTRCHRYWNRTFLLSHGV